LPFIGFDAPQSCVVSASGRFSFVDPRSGAAARGGLFLRRSGREKPQLAFRVKAVSQWLSGGPFWVVNAKKSHAYRLDERGAVTDQRYALQSRSTAFPTGRDALS
jgi:hypothetical protein